MRRFVLCFALFYFVLVFFSPFSIAITSLREESANLSAFRMFVLVWFCRFPPPLDVWEGLRFVIAALPGLFSYLFWNEKCLFTSEEHRKYISSTSTINIIYDHVKRFVKPSYAFWIIYLFNLTLNFTDKWQDWQFSPCHRLALMRLPALSLSLSHENNLILLNLLLYGDYESLIRLCRCIADLGFCCLHLQ